MHKVTSWNKNYLNGYIPSVAGKSTQSTMDIHLSCAREIYFTLLSVLVKVTLSFLQHVANGDLTALYELKFSFSACLFRECFIDGGAIIQAPMVSQMYNEKYTESSATFTLCTCALPIDLILNSEMIMEGNNFLLQPQRKIKNLYSDYVLKTYVPD